MSIGHVSAVRQNAQTCHKGTAMRVAARGCFRIAPSDSSQRERQGARGAAFVTQRDFSMRKQRSITGLTLVAVSLAFTPIPLHSETFTGTAFAVSEDGDL